MRPPSISNLRAFVAAAALALALGCVFWLPSREAARGYFPTPLDDVYIHFDFARSFARGAPFEWIPGNGYSSGETAPLYAAVLAVGCALGASGRALGWWAALVAIVAVASFVRSVQRLSAPCPTWLAWGLALFALSFGIVDWTLFSGMEIALFAALLGRSLEALARSRRGAGQRGGLTREASQRRLGAWGAAMVLVRPEAGVLVAIFAIIAARGAGRRSGALALARAAMPGAIATGLVLSLNRAMTGEAQSAGALVKLLASNPYLSEVDRARAYVENLVTFALKGVRAELATLPFVALVVPLLALASVVPRARRPTGAACLVGAVAWLLVVSLNVNAPHHNFRYYVPAFLLVIVAAASGAAAIAHGLFTKPRPIFAAALVGLVSATAAARVPAQVTHFRRAVANIRDQQIEVGERLRAHTTPSDIVLLGDAGAIPFVSERPAVDALGLGGFRRMPFARAAVNGEAATVELIERLAPAERPTYLALYPNWFGALTAHFGTPVDRVSLVDNLICGGPTKVIYRADWSALGPPSAPRDDVVDELDVADVLSERDHEYLPPVPRGGWTTLDVRLDEDGARRFDAGRILPAGARESFVVRRTSSEARVRIVVRIDAEARKILLRTPSAVTELALAPARDDAWREAVASIETPRVGDVLTLEAVSGAYRNYHVWLMR